MSQLKHPKLGHLAPFWAVMLAEPDTFLGVNMHSYMEEYKLSPPTPTMFGALKFNVDIVVKIPFLTNNVALEPGSLLVLPHDGGAEEIVTRPPSPHIRC